MYQKLFAIKYIAPEDLIFLLEEEDGFTDDSKDMFGISVREPILTMEYMRV